VAAAADEARQPRGVGTRLNLLEAARSRFAELGYERTRLVDVTADAGVTTGALYRHFDGKAELFGELLDQLDRSLTEAVDGAEDLGSFARAWLRAARRHRGTVRAAAQVEHAEPAFLERLRATRARWAEQVEPLLGGRRGKTRRAAGFVVVDALQYVAFAEAMGWVRDPSRAVARTLEELVAGGLYGHGAGGAAPRRARRRRPPMRPVLRWEPATGRAVPSSARGRAQRDAILEAAEEVFAALGYTGATMQLIADAAEVSSGSAYRYFEDKADVFGCLLATVESELYEQSVIEADDRGRLLVRPAALAYLALRRRHRGVYRAWRELLEPGSAYATSWVAMRRQFQHGIATALERGQAAGLVRAQLAPDTVGELAVAMFDQPAHCRHDLGWEEGGPDDELAIVLSALLGSGLFR
jgi:AcrR family transcriptional regulator